MHQHPHLPPRLARGLKQRFVQLRGGHVLDGHLAAIQPLQRFGRVGTQPGSVSVDLHAGRWVGGSDLRGYRNRSPVP